MNEAAAAAAAAYRNQIAEIRATMSASTREFASAMTAASVAYESAMVADLGAVRAAKLGAGRRSL